MARVLPVPAPARTHSGPVRCWATARWSSSRAARSSSLLGMAVLVIPASVSAPADTRAGRPQPTAAEILRAVRALPSVTDHHRLRGDVLTTTTPAPGSITMYTTSWCGYCRRLKKQLEGEGIAYQEVNIEEHPEAASFVEEVNGGNQTVPTVLFPDGSSATNPSLAEVRTRLG